MLPPKNVMGYTLFLEPISKILNPIPHNDYLQRLMQTSSNEFAYNLHSGIVTCLTVHITHTVFFGV